MNMLDMYCIIIQVMDRDAKLMREDGPTIFSQAKHMVGVPDIAKHILDAYHYAVN